MKMGKIYKLVKLILFVAAGIAILVCNKLIMNEEGAIINGLVGTIIAIYGIEGILLPIFTHKIKSESVEMLNGAVNVVIAVIMIFLLEGHPYELRIVCVLWSVWSIMREGVEIYEKAVEGFKKHPITSTVNLAESVVVIVFSIMLITAKDAHELEHHAHAHVILLGIELIIEVIWVYVGEFEARCLRRIRRRRHKEELEHQQEQQNEEAKPVEEK